MNMVTRCDRGRAQYFTASIPRLSVAVLFAVLLEATTIAIVRAQSADALVGQVKSADEGPMEGVLVSAKKMDSTIKVTVATDELGRYRFPSSRLPPGEYQLSVRAPGYQLSRSASVAIGEITAYANLELGKARDPAGQMSDAEWLMSMPGTEAEKHFLHDCNACHSIQRIVRSRHNADEWLTVLERMSKYAYNSSSWAPQLRPVPRPFSRERNRPVAEYLATINLSKRDTWEYPLKTLPHPKGRATRMVITEYDLRPASMPHDVVVDAQGNAWWTDFTKPILGMLDPKTGATLEHAIPLVKPRAPTGSNSLELDANGTLWTANLQQSAISEFDPRTKQFKVYPLSPTSEKSSIAMISPPSPTDPRIWTNDEGLHGLHRLDPATGKWESVGPIEDPTGREVGTYGVFRDQEDNGYVFDYSPSGRYISKVDAKTLAVSLIPIPTENSWPRRGRVDAKRAAVWFAEYAGNKLARFEFSTGLFQEWAMPTQYSWPYDAVEDKNGEVWTGSMWTDYVTRLDPKTGTFTQYLLPQETNIRRVFIDNSTNPVTFWTGNNLHASIVKLEPLD
jgi:streptogramin lyase